MRSLLLAATALIAYVAPASATLQVAATINGISFTCIDNGGACDTNAAIGTISLADQIIGGVTVNGSVQTSTGTPANPSFLDSLNTSSLSIINGNAIAVDASVAVSDTSFTFPVSAISLSGSGTWQTAVGSSATLSWYADTGNTQGADTSTDTPGVLLASFTSTPTLIVDSLSYNNSVGFVAGAPFSMTERVAMTLSPGAQLISRGQTMVAVVDVPEPMSLAMLGVGMLGIAVFRRRA